MSRATETPDEIQKMLDQFLLDLVLKNSGGSSTQRRAKIRRAQASARFVLRCICSINAPLEHNQMAVEDKEAAVLLRDRLLRALTSPTFYATGVPVGKDGNSEFLF